MSSTMQIQPGRCFNLILLAFLFALLQFHHAHCRDFEFSKTHFGVTFTPFVKQMKNGRSYEVSYAFENIKTMLTIISKRFSRVITTEIGANYGSYVLNYTYYHNARAIVYSGEIAAQINRESGEKRLTLLLSVSQHTAREDTDTGVKLALESAEKANKIFPGTVEAIVFDRSITPERGQQTLNYMQLYRKKALDSGVKFALKQICSSDKTFNLFKQNNSYGHVQRQIMLESEIIICDGIVLPEGMDTGPEHTFLAIGLSMLGVRNKFKEFNPNAEVIFTSLWLTGGYQEWQTVDNLRRYWEAASLWAVKNNFTVYMAEAFDNPWRASYEPSYAHMGWWKLNDEYKINLVDGYTEKVLESNTVNTRDGNENHGSKINNTDNKNVNPGNNPATSWSHASIVLTVIGSLIILIGLAGIVLLFCRGEKKSAVLSKVEIQHFLFGTSARFSAGEDLGDTIGNALNSPYENSFEIPKDKLIIDHSSLLGSGKFGYVMKAYIKANHGELAEVAVKVAKTDTQMSALRGLLSEIKIMTYLGKHANIVSLEGAYTAELSKGVVYVATELCSLGSLQNFLRENRTFGPKSIIYYNMTEMITTSSVSFVDMARWSHEIACGMLHLENKHVVHADLATRNVLLTSDKTAKIADFGLSRRMYNYVDYVKTHKEPLPWRSMAIESLNRMEFSTKSDVWGYAVTLWEIFSMGDTPYRGRAYDKDFVEELVEGLRPKRPSFASQEIYEMMQKCWSTDPKLRPGFSELVRYTAGVLRERRNEDDGLIYLKLQDPHF